jgi:hypothetical protein
VTDLRHIQNAIDNYAKTVGELPDELDQLNLDPEDLLDPETEEEYGYTPLDSRRYQLSARFHFSDDENYRWYDEDWSHDAGQHEFSFEIPGKDAKTDDTA